MPFGKIGNGAIAIIKERRTDTENRLSVAFGGVIGSAIAKPRLPSFCGSGLKVVDDQKKVLLDILGKPLDGVEVVKSTSEPSFFGG